MWCRGNGIDANRMDSVVNKTPLSAKTNRMIGSNAPSVYLERMERKAGLTADALDDVVRTHAVEPVHLRADDFESFFRARADALLTRIEQAMGKRIARDIQAAAEPEADDADDGEADE